MAKIRSTLSREVHPIIPITGDAYLSDRFKLISGETDLIDIHRPQYAEGMAATLEAVDQMDKISNTLNAMRRYSNPTSLKTGELNKNKPSGFSRTSILTPGRHFVFQINWDTERKRVSTLAMT